MRMYIYVNVCIMRFKRVVKWNITICWFLDTNCYHIVIMKDKKFTTTNKNFVSYKLKGDLSQTTQQCKGELPLELAFLRKMIWNTMKRSHYTCLPLRMPHRSSRRDKPIYIFRCDILRLSLFPVENWPVTGFDKALRHISLKVCLLFPSLYRTYASPLEILYTWVLTTMNRCLNIPYMYVC